MSIWYTVLGNNEGVQLHSSVLQCSAVCSPHYTKCTTLQLNHHTAALCNHSITLQHNIIAAMQRTLTATTHFTMLSVSYSLYAIYRLGNKCFNLVLLYQSLQQAPVCVRMYVCVCVTNLSKFSKTVCNTMQHSSTLCNTIQLSSVTKCNHTL